MLEDWRILELKVDQSQSLTVGEVTSTQHVSHKWDIGANYIKKLQFCH
jgi:hypothetical protein